MVTQYPEAGAGQRAGTAADIAARVAALHGPDAHKAAPVLALGTSERVGSNWLSDLLRASMPQHNEPFRQQLGRGHPLSPTQHVPVDLDGVNLGGLGQHHLACALADLYGHPRHMVKETNLYFASGSVLALLPHSPVIVLTRAPVGIAGSFSRGGLWSRWHYADRYAQLAATARSPRWRAFAPLLPQDDPEAPVGLGRLIALNTLLLAHALSDRAAMAAVSYERHVKDPDAVVDDLTRALGIALPQRSPAPRAPAAQDATWATTGGKDELVAEVEAGAAELVRDQVAITLARARSFLGDSVINTASQWLAGDDMYEVRAHTPRKLSPARSLAPVRDTPKPLYRPMTPKVSWRNLLVTNAEMADLLNLLHAAGLPNTCYGTNLLVCPMPHGRGGRLHFDRGAHRWQVSQGYDFHPAYWVTWLGAAVMAAWQGARLPTRAEALAVTAGVRPHNSDYAVGDTSPVTEPGLGPEQVHHLVGNLQIWCSDGPALSRTQPLQRHLFGAAWNTPGTDQAITSVRSRYLLGASRGVGVRLVRCARTGETTGLGAWELAARVNRWIDALDGGTDGPAPSLGERDRRLIATLDQSPMADFGPM